ncbi:hypothetical protein M9H77_24934 [Catharanthus roseus]|uniref:Uncharacterized protein n=1 Tax=Catharanthus roseus TaxID=4058 RepID=A0ACC0A5U6_CATRO|nr:hypothetical protein M9H77_24934 [Catharanthus roseus]
MAGGYKKQGYAWAVSAGLNAALAAISAKFFQPQLVRYGLVILFNAIMWGCYVNSLKALSSLQATVTNFATNFLSSGLAGFFLFEEALQYQWFLGAALIFPTPLSNALLAAATCLWKPRTAASLIQESFCFLEDHEWQTVCSMKYEAGKLQNDAENG